MVDVRAESATALVAALCCLVEAASLGAVAVDAIPFVVDEEAIIVELRLWLWLGLGLGLGLGEVPANWVAVVI